ncbi:MAG: hypothetical protein ABUL46_06830, partial [Chitinophaga rupis]
SRLGLSVLLLYTLGLISFSLFLMCVILFSGIAFGISSRIQPAWQLLSRIEPEMNALYEQLQVLEKGSFRTTLLQRLQTEIRGADGLPASVLMRQFRSILRRFDYRLNMLVFFFLNTFLFWDLRQLLALNRWKEKNRSLLPAWISALAETEVLISLASLARNEPDWCFPEVNDRFFNLSATGTGHPLIPAEQRVTNDFSMEGPGRVAVITGSNMAGKSTFLRTLGINLVLAFMGAPVCATAFRASHLYLLSSMRVADNLAEHTSTFYAELKKLQFILEQVSEGRP